MSEQETCGTPSGKPSDLAPGDIVRHLVRHENGDNWVGVVTEIVTTRTMSYTSEVVRVRWIKPCGDPSEGTTSHDAKELVLLC